MKNDLLHPSQLLCAHIAHCVCSVLSGPGRVRVPAAMVGIQERGCPELQSSIIPYLDPSPLFLRLRKSAPTEDILFLCTLLLGVIQVFRKSF